MKNILLTFLTLIISLTAFSQLHSAKILDPEDWSRQVDDAVFKNIEMHITPQGAFANVELQMEVNALSYKPYSGQQLEVEYFFSLPKGSILHEAYLWMNDSAIKADLYERSQATIIYESFVNRRTDPLIIYKDNDFYEAKIYPLVKDENRNFKLCFLTPIKIEDGAPVVELPVNLFHKHVITSDVIHITIEQSSIWGKPLPMKYATPSHRGNISEFYISGSKLNPTHNQVIFENKNFNDRLFKAPIDENSGYFQMILKDTAHLNQGTDDKYLIILDAPYIYERMRPDDFFHTLRENLLYHFSPLSKFKILYKNQSSIKMSSEEWHFVDSANIENALTQIRKSQSTYNDGQLDQMLLRAKEEIVSNPNSNIKIITFTQSPPLYWSTPSYNELLESLLDDLPENVSFHTAALNQDNWGTTWGQGFEYLNNEYLLRNLAIRSSGNYLSCMEIQRWSVIQKSSPQSIMASLFSSLSKSKSFEGFNHNGNSILYQTADISTQGFGDDRTYLLTGKYTQGLDTLNLTHYYEESGDFYTRKVQLEAEEILFNLTNKIWAGTYYNNEINPQNSFSKIAEIVQGSFDFEVLTDYTAFLALEPEEDFTIQGEHLVSVEDVESKYLNTLEVKAFPNPFSTKLALEIFLPNELRNKKISIVMYDLQGRAIANLTSTSSTDETTIINLDELCLGRESGIYVLKVQIENISQNIRIVKR